MKHRHVSPMMNWSPIPKLPDAIPCDAMLTWAWATEFKHLVRPGEAVDQGLLPVLVELKDPEQATEFARLVAADHGVVPHYPIAEWSVRTAMLPRKVLADWTHAAWAPLVENLSLQASVLPQRPRPRPRGVPFERHPTTEPPQPSSSRPRSDTEVLLGVIDSACPFAHPHLRRMGEKNASTRILNWWVQDDDALGGATGVGVLPPDFQYGCEADRQALDAVMAAQQTLGVVNEADCYEAVGAQALRHRFTHGAAVLDLLASPLDLVARMGASADASPTWSAPGDAASAADVVVVQLPSDAVQDASSGGLARYLLDGIHYILSCAKDPYQPVVINISDGSSRGTHDGESPFERAVVALLNDYPQLHIVLAAGNSFNESRHAQIDRLAAHTKEQLVLRLPPDCESPAFVLVRLPDEKEKEKAKNLRLRAYWRAGHREDEGSGKDDPKAWVARGEAKAWYLNTPSAAGQAPQGQPVCSVIFPAIISPESSAATALLAWAPTRVADDTLSAAPSGEWVIELASSEKVTEAIHFYIARNQTNPGALPRHGQARFIDPTGRDDPQRHVAPLEDDLPADDAPSSAPRSVIRRHGTLSALATASHPRLYVVGAYLLKEGAPSLYSSEGPVAGASQRPGLNAWAPADTHRSLAGVRASGTVGGTVLRVTGTSFAAPQIARQVANLQRRSSGPNSPDPWPVKMSELRRRVSRI